MAENESPETQEEAPAEAPADLTAEQVSKIVADAMNDRVSGLMSSFDKRFNNLQSDFRRATMTQDEIEDQAEKDEAEELARLRKENAILSAGTEMPAAVRAFQELNAKDSGKEQLEYLQSLIDAAAQTGSAAPVSDGDAQDEEGTPDVPVDSNAGSNPRADLDVEKAGNILDQFQNWPGADFFKR